MASVWWYWDSDQKGFSELLVEATIRNDIGDFSERNGVYLLLGQGSISDALFYFGIQTSVYDARVGRWQGEGLIFSRWNTRDLDNARIAEDGWAQSSGHEGDFIGVRIPYNWGAGDYRVRLASDGQDPDGEWFGLWISDLESGKTTWVGSLKFPYVDGRALIRPRSYTSIEIYGSSPIRPIDIPEIALTVKIPSGDGIPSTIGCSDYSVFHGEIENSEARYDRESESVYLKAGGHTQRETFHSECVRFLIVPAADPPGIRGVVTGPEGQPLERVALWVKRGEETYSVATGPNGTFDVLVPSGSFIVEVSVLVESEYFFVGWYDGIGGITNDPSQLSEVIVEGPEVIDIRLPADTEVLLCASGSHRSTVTRRCL